MTVTVNRCPMTGHGARRTGELLLAFFGTSDFAVPSLERIVAENLNLKLVITSPTKPKGRGLKLLPSPVRLTADRLRLNVLEPENPNNEDFLNELKNYNLDLCVLVAYGFILRPPLLALPKMGFINLHPSLLPKYRGAAPINRVIINGETETGVTTFKMNERVDAGPIILTRETLINSFETCAELSKRLSILGADLIVETLRLIQSGNCSLIPQDETQATYAPKIKKEERIIDWNQDAYKIHNLIRGLSPTPAAYTYFRNKRVEIYRTRIENTNTESGLLTVKDKELMVGTGKGSLIISELKVEGKRMMTGQDFINGYRPKPQEKFHYFIESPSPRISEIG